MQASCQPDLGRKQATYMYTRILIPFCVCACAHATFCVGMACWDLWCVATWWQTKMNMPDFWYLPRGTCLSPNCSISNIMAWYVVQLSLNVTLCCCYFRKIWEMLQLVIKLKDICFEQNKLDRQQRVVVMFGLFIEQHRAPGFRKKRVAGSKVNQARLRHGPQRSNGVIQTLLFAYLFNNIMDICQIHTNSVSAGPKGHQAERKGMDNSLLSLVFTPWSLVSSLVESGCLIFKLLDDGPFLFTQKV